MALSRLTSSDWAQFEQLASIFIASDYNSLRTMASPSGDGGRDSELFADNAESTTAIQYSVTKEWKSKIRHTKKRLSESFPVVDTLIYVTNQVIGAAGDDIRRELRKAGTALDIWDESWFLDRANADKSREDAAEALARKFVDPLLPSDSAQQGLVAGLESEEAKTALLFLEMQVQDSDRSLGLTKLSYDTLTLAALRDTSTAKRIKRADIYKRVQGFLPTHPFNQTRMKIDASLRRLEQKAIRHRKEVDEYHLLDSEIARVTSSVARIDSLRRNFESDLTNVLDAALGITIVNRETFVSAARRTLETYFLKKGEDFAQASVRSEPHAIDETTLKMVAIDVAKQNIGVTGRPGVDVLLNVLTILISTPAPATSAYLRLLLESYTLFAFLAATPDVQKATRNMFGRGEIWLDTSVLLPVLAETAVTEERRPFTEMFKQARNAGLKLYVTQGVLEEIERHINRSKAYARSNEWHGDVPFLYSSYALAGGVVTGFSKWLERFIGDLDPVQDISDYLQRYHHILLESAANHEKVPQSLADGIRQAWQDVTMERRSGDANQLHKLAAHDAEMYLHVLSSRLGQQGRAPLGYTDWWLTLDTKARRIMDRVEPTLRPRINTGPVLSIDYLIRYLSFGPSRERVDVTGTALAKIYADTLVEPIPPELMSLVTQLRAQHADLAENVVERRIRDTLNSERSRLGVIDAGGPLSPSDLLAAAY
ncbi:MAG: hypothetical protein ACRYFW_00525 [Janthinobacterium lividum]